MFNDLLRRLTAPHPAPLPELDGRLALGAMLVRVAKSDGSYAVEEIQRIDRILAQTYELNPVEAARLRADSERLETVAPEDGRFTDAVRACTDKEDREAILVELWQVILADGVERIEEDTYLHRAAERLGLDEAAIERAHKEAAQG